jgi:hypothetical protein
MIIALNGRIVASTLLPGSREETDARIALAKAMLFAGMGVK